MISDFSNNSYLSELNELTRVSWTSKGNNELQADLVNDTAQQVFDNLKNCGIEATLSLKGNRAFLTISRAAIKPLLDKTFGKSWGLEHPKMSP